LLPVQYPIHAGVSLFILLPFLSVLLEFVSDSVVMFEIYCHMSGQLDELLASLAARCRVYLLSSLYCILFIAR